MKKNQQRAMRQGLAVIILLASFITQGVAQNTGGEEKKPKVKVLVTAGPEVNLTIPTDFGTRTDQVAGDTLFKFTPQIRYRFGMALRCDFSRVLSFQTGLYYINRNYNVKVGRGNVAQARIDTLFFDESYTYTGFEIPLMALFYVQLGEKWFMNNAVGFSMDFFPSNAKKDEPNLPYEVLNTRRSWIIPSIKASVGFEFRTLKAGYFYLGGQFHRPLVPTSDVFVERSEPGTIGLQTVQTPLSGTYFAIDLKYFFNPGDKVKFNK